MLCLLIFKCGNKFKNIFEHNLGQTKHSEGQSVREQPVCELQTPCSLKTLPILLSCSLSVSY